VRRRRLLAPWLSLLRSRVCGDQKSVGQPVWCSARRHAGERPVSSSRRVRPNVSCCDIWTVVIGADGYGQLSETVYTPTFSEHLQSGWLTTISVRRRIRWAGWRAAHSGHWLPGCGPGELGGPILTRHCRSPEQGALCAPCSGLDSAGAVGIRRSSAIQLLHRPRPAAGRQTGGGRRTLRSPAGSGSSG